MSGIGQVAALSGWVMNCISYRLGLILAVNVNKVTIMWSQVSLMWSQVSLMWSQVSLMRSQVSLTVAHRTTCCVFDVIVLYSAATSSSMHGYNYPSNRVWAGASELLRHLHALPWE